MPVGRSPGLSGRRRSCRKGPATPSSRAPTEELPPLPPGTEIEARIDDEGFYGSWFEATVVGFEPAASTRFPARYAVAYSHLVSQDDGPEPVAASHVRPRPPPPPPSSPAPGFRLHDIVEAFDAGGWWSGIVVAPVSVPDLALADPGSAVTVAFPITREVMTFPPHLVRRRLDYVGGGEWVPSLSVVAIQPKRGARVYKAGEKVEVVRERDAWFPATVAKAVDRLSYIVEYLDEQGNGGKATEYLHFGYIRPAEYPRLRESKVQLGLGTAVEVNFDGAWSQGVVRRVVREGCDCEYEVSVDGVEAEQLLITKAKDQLRPLCKWNGKHWTIPTDDKGQHNSRHQYASRKHPISLADAASSGDESLQRASVCETNASLSGAVKSFASNQCLNSCSLLSEKNGVSGFPHRTLNTCSMSTNGLLCSSLGHSTPPDELIPNVVGETEISQDVLPEMALSDGQHETSVYGRNANETCDMLLTPEARQLNIASSLRNHQTQERPTFVNRLCVKKGITKNKSRETHRKAHQVKNNASYHVQIQFMGNRNFSSKQFLSASSAAPECQKTSAQTQQVTGGRSSGSDAEGLNFNLLARKEGTGLFDKELAATINRICQGDINADVCTDTVDTQVTKTKSNPLTDTPILSHDRLVSQDRNRVDERSILQSLQNSGSSMFTSDNILSSSFSCSGALGFAFSVSDHMFPFVKSSPAWNLMDAMDVFKEVPQQPHFRPLRKFLPPLREGMALGLMVTFANSVEDIRKSSISDSTASFEEKIATLCQLEENGFSVQFLRCRLDKLLQIKSDHSSSIAKKEHLKAQLLEKTTLLSQIDERLEKKEEVVVHLEEGLRRARWEAQKIMEEKEREHEEILRLKAADCSVEEACGCAELQFHRVLAEIQHMRLS